MSIGVTGADPTQEPEGAPAATVGVADRRDDGELGSDGPGSRAGSGRRQHLDGIRAVAVYLVVAFHAGSPRFSGGFIGVDVFFVLSGYLVTQVLLREVEGKGRVRFGRFYARRVRRLLPASFVMLVVTALAYAAVAPSSLVIESRRAFQAAFLYVANWFFIRESTSYFAADAERSPVLHMWSLAVEEQFYLVWPLLLAALVWATRRFARRPDRALLIAVLVGAAASAGWAWSLRTADPDRAYMGSDARAYQLLAGAALALTPALFAWAGRIPKLTRVAVPGAVLAIVFLATFLDRLDPIQRGLAVTVVAAGLIVGLDAPVASTTKRALGLPAVAYLGRISYGTYLWHWPIVVILGELIELSPRSLALVVALLATGLASLSFELLETPVRRSALLDRFSWPVVVVGLALSVLGAALVIPRITDSGRSSTNVEAAAGAASGDGSIQGTPIPSWFDLPTVYWAKFGETVDCLGKEPEECTVVRGSGRHVLLMGDSNAQMWIPAFTAMATERDLTLSLAVGPGCMWQREVYKLSVAVNERCRALKEDWYDRVIPALDPDVIVLINAREPNGEPKEDYVDDALARTLRRSTPASVRELGAGGRDVVIVEPAPTPPGEKLNPLDCLDQAQFVEECRFVAPTFATWHERLTRNLDERSERIWSVDFDRLVCPFLPVCDPILGERVVFWNGVHMAEAYSRSLGPEVGRRLEEIGVIPPA